MTWSYFFSGLLLFISSGLTLLSQSTGVIPVVPVVVTPSSGNETAAAPPTLFGISGGGAAELGQEVVLRVSFAGTGSDQSYQWRKNSADIVGATSASYTLPSAVAGDAATYTVAVSNAAGTSVASTSVSVKALSSPVVTSSPSSRTVSVGQAVTFSFAATGSYPRTYRWLKNGTAITGATGETYEITNTVTDDAGSYSVVVSNSQGSSTSASASLTVNAATPLVLNGVWVSPSDGRGVQGGSVTLGVGLISGSGPASYQWIKNGVPVVGATGTSLSLSPLVLSDAGKYSIIVSNILGSVTSSEVTVAVDTARPPAIVNPPQPVTVTEGQVISLFGSMFSNAPITYQWHKNGIAISGATNTTYRIERSVRTDAGSYTLVATTIAGSVTSNPVLVTVNAAVAPSITTQPASQTVDFNSNPIFSVQAAGSSPFTYSWRKDGVVVSGGNGSSSLFFSGGVTPANNGVYTVVVTNMAGSITSNGATLSVRAPIAPVIATQPISIEVAIGLSAAFNVGYSSVGTGPLTVQWRKNGVPIANASSSYLTLSNVKEADAGDYTVAIVGPGGSVTSATAKLTVLQAAAPRVSFWPTGVATNVGQSTSFSFGTTGGSPPFTYQWAKNGAPISGATSAVLSFQSVTAADFGIYTVTVSNEGGIIASPGIKLSQAIAFPYNNSSAEPWLDVGRVGDTVYFLATLPARIERYDLAAERWLATTLLSETKVPTSFALAPDAVYIAYGRAIARRPLDLASETPIANVAADVTHLFVFENFLYYMASGLGSRGYGRLNRTTFQVGSQTGIGGFSAGYRQVALAPSLRKGFGLSTGVSPADIETFTIAADGSSSSTTDSPYHGTMPVGTRAYVFPGEQFVGDNSGTRYRTSDLTYAGSFGEPFNDLAFFDDGSPVVLRGTQLVRTRSDNLIETARTKIALSGLRLFTRGAVAYVFGVPAAAGSAYAVTKVSSGAFAPVGAPAEGPLPSGRYSVDDAFLGEGGIVYIFSRTLQGLVRWDPATRTFLATRTLRSAPGAVFHQPGNPRVILAYPDGVISELPLRANAVENTLTNVGHNVRAIADLGDMFTVNISDYGSSGDSRLIYTASGPKFIDTSLYEASGLAWLPSSRRLYSTPAFSSTLLQYETITAAGALTTISGSSASTSQTATPPIRFNADNTLLATMNGRIFNADLAQVGVLSNDIVDAVWLGNTLYTVRSRLGLTEIQQWTRTTYLQAGTVTLKGTPVRILRLSDSQLLVVSSLQGSLFLSLVNADLTLPAAPNFAGSYFGQVGAGGTAGSFALQLKEGQTGTLLVHLAGAKSAILASGISINANGSIVANGLTLDSGVTRAVYLSIAPDGTVTGSVPSLNLTLGGNKTGGSSGSVGFYRAVGVNGAAGDVYAMVGSDDRALVVMLNSTALDGGVGTADSTGKLTVAISAGAQLTGSLNASTGSLGVTADKGGFAGTTFSGLRDDVARTDRLVNIASRGSVSASELMIAGFVITGTAPKPVMIRATGPALAPFGLTGTLANPKLGLYRGNDKILENDDWSLAANYADIAAAATRTGAFALAAGSLDAALLTTLSPGAYTAQVSSVTGSSGVALVEVYDAGSTAVTADTPRLINISTRANVAGGESLLIAGVVITGNSPKKILIRATGPALAAFGVPGALTDPLLKLYKGDAVLRQNDNWSDSATEAALIAAAGSATGAFALTPGTKDAALLITLEPGAYTAQGSGVAGAAGAALVEVYEVP